ncbi:cuticle protein 21.3 isoform X1 [Toxorhynchites rutilus septentrionalis]|uniref:cuticle protein 21.3 isoform X1 n=1 Tax=Toxorhynchites rutilus septentrionalis TaxID=329112 RepID=UPI00247934BD|nr:cuticle protein 21.3 isoform X1 [Toxorhynchites rutilus septentrionalis]
MAFKYVILAALVACVSAGGPAAYSIAAPSLGYGSVGASHEHTVKGLYGQNVLSQYSKAVDSAHSSVRVHSSRLSNDGIAYAPHYAAAAYPAAHYAAPAVRYAAPAIAPAVHYGGAAVVKAAYPAYGHAYGAPAYGHAYGAAAYGHAFAAAPVVKAAAYPAYGHGYAAPLAAAPLAHPGAVVQFAGLGAHYAW